MKQCLHATLGRAPTAALLYRSMAPQFNFVGSSSLRSARDSASMHARRLAKPASVCALKIREHLPIASFELGENFIDARKHSPDNLDRFAPQGVEFAPQLLYISLAFFTATGEIVHASPTICFMHELLKQPA